MEDKLIKISEAAGRLGVSIDTLRRWDKSGKLVAIKKEGGTHRYYHEKDIEVFTNNLFQIAFNWAFNGVEISKDFYCKTSDVFRARLEKMGYLIMQKPGFEKLYSLIVLIAGEIGDNSFAHNIGKWPDEPGVFFAYDIQKGIVVLADRGLGILETLRPVRPDLSNHIKAVQVAFTEFVSGRAPEKRGNGLKLVREVVLAQPIDLFFASGDAELYMQGAGKTFKVTRGQYTMRGCIAKIKF